MSTPVKACNTMEYSEWLEARHERPEQPMFAMRHYERGMGISEEVVVRIYEAVEKFLEMVEEEIDYLRLQWKQENNGPNDPSTYCSFRVFIKAGQGEEVEHGYDDPPEYLVKGEGRAAAFNDLVEACELVDPDTWNHFVTFKIFYSGQIANCGELRECMKNENLDEFVAARTEWIMKNDTQPASAPPRAVGLGRM